MYSGRQTRGSVHLNAVHPVCGHQAEVAYYVIALANSPDHDVTDLGLQALRHPHRQMV